MAYRREENHNDRCRKQHRLDVWRRNQWTQDPDRLHSVPKDKFGVTKSLASDCQKEQTLERALKTHHSGFAFEIESQD